MNRTVFASLFFGLFAVACTENADEEFRFRVENTRLPISTAFPVSRPAPSILVKERFVAFLASEADHGQNLNAVSGDGDTLDHVPVLVNMVSRDQFVIGVAARDFVFLGNHLFLEVDENADGKAWDGDTATDDCVLLRVPALSPAYANVLFVATLRSGAGGAALPGAHMVVTDNNRLFFNQAASLTPGADETTLSMIRLTGGVPGAPERLNSQTQGNLTPLLVGHEANVVFTTLDETLDGDLNGDLDGLDPFVLALVDANAATPVVKSTGLPLASISTPLRALDISGERIVSFLVSEAAHGAGSLNNQNDVNNPITYPAQCVGADADSTDNVMHYLLLSAWLGVAPPENTFLAGADRIVIVKNGANTFLATLVPEADEGNCATGINLDGDTTDRILRWVRAVPTGGFVFSDADELVAVRNVAGGTNGVTDLAGRLVAVIDEAADDRNWDANVAIDNDIVAWLDPTDGPTSRWVTDHDAASAGVQATGTRWMAEMPDRSRALLGFEESVVGLSLNGRDNDTNDTLPVFVRFDPNDDDDLDFPGPGVGAQDNNVGTVIVAGIAYYRVDELDDNFDWNRDGDKNDLVLFRTTVATLSDSFFIATLNGLTVPAVSTDATNTGAAFIIQESLVRNLNGDADTDDFVVFWMRTGP